METETSRDPDPIALAIGQEVRSARLRLGLSTRELAGRIDTSQPFVSNIENGRIFPSLRTLTVIAEALQVATDQLLPAREHLVRVGAARGMRTRRPPEAAARILLNSPSAMMQAHRIELAAGETEPRPFVHPGHDFLFVISGGMDLLREGLPGHTLTAGESTSIVGPNPHRLAGTEGTGGVALLIATDGHHLIDGSDR